MHIVVTGGAGFIGSHLVARLARMEPESLTVLDNLRRGSMDHIAQLGGAVRFVEGDVRDRRTLARAFRHADLVFHLAAQSNVLGAHRDPEYSFSSNVQGTWNVLHAARACGAARVVFTSSREVYGEPASLPVAETAPLNPKNAYGASKAAGEMYCRAMSDASMRVAILRLTNVYGPRDRDRVIPLFVERALRGRPLMLYGGNQVIDFVWIDAVVDALVAAGFGACPAEPVNVGSGRGTTLADLAARVRQVTGSRSRIRTVPARSAEVVRFTADVSRAQSVLGLRCPEDPLFALGMLVESSRSGGHAPYRTAATQAV